MRIPYISALFGQGLHCGSDWLAIYPAEGEIVLYDDYSTQRRVQVAKVNFKDDADAFGMADQMIAEGMGVA